MSDKDVFKDREKAMEDTYFHNQDQELIAKMKVRILREEERRKLAQAAHTDDSEIIDVLQELGYTVETLPVLFLMPVIKKLWDSGEIDNHKRKVVEDLAASHGLPRGSAGFEKLSSFLAERPSDDVVEINLLAIKALLVSLPEEERKIVEGDMVTNARTIAKAGRGLFGLENIPRLARESVDQFLDDLGIKPENKP